MQCSLEFKITEIVLLVVVKTMLFKIEDNRGCHFDMR